MTIMINIAIIIMNGTTRHRDAQERARYSIARRPYDVVVQYATMQHNPIFSDLARQTIM